MNLFLIGDVHGCYHTLLELLQHWNPAEEVLLQTGDLVDRGHYSPECVQLAQDLQARHPNRTVFLLGNHEYEMLKHYGPHGPNPAWMKWGGRETVQQYKARPSWLQPHLAWVSQRPLFWENDHVLVSHAGFADVPEPLNPENMDGVLWRRGPLLNVGKRQVIGHTPTASGQPTFDSTANVFNIDTGAYMGQALTGLRLSPTGELLAEFSVPTHSMDIS
jgi:serine/threonine protein phosphatase 1